MFNQIVGESISGASKYALIFRYHKAEPSSLDRLRTDIGAIARGGVPVTPDEKVTYAYGRHRAPR